MSTGQSVSQSAAAERSAAVQWRSWPFVDRRRWSWLALVFVAGIGGGVLQLSRSWPLAILAAVGLTITLWSFFLPAYYEITPVGLRRRVLGRTRLVPWHAIRAYRLRPAGIVLYQRSDPIAIDLLRSMFIPYPPDPDDLLYAVRQYASHARELEDT